MEKRNGSEDESWLNELETALLANCDLSVLRTICNRKHIPSKLRPEFWQTCLGAKGKSTTLSELSDLNEQCLIRNDCENFVDALSGNEYDKSSVIKDVESIISTFAKRKEVTYYSNNGWLELLQPLLALKLPRNDVYNCFEAILEKFIPKYFVSNTDDDEPFHLLRLLLLYHDPELCSFLDSRKITPDMYVVTWFRSLFSAHCSNKVIHSLWDVYFLLSDPSLLFYISLVMLVNVKYVCLKFFFYNVIFNRREQVMEMKDESKEKIIETLNSVPSALDIEDIDDLFYLAEQHYVSQTPRSFKVENELSSLMFTEVSSCQQSQFVTTDLAHALCLPVPVIDLLPDTPISGSVRYFVVDCRPAEQYNNGHLSTAFHLNCSLMLEAPSAFETAVQALLACISMQQHSINAGSVVGGKHLCFMGSGRIEEDQDVYMVVASFLQKHQQFVSLAFNGYTYLHEYAVKNSIIDKYIVDHNRKQCIPCRFPPGTQSLNNVNSKSLFGKKMETSDHFNNWLFTKVATVVKSKSIEMKGKLVEYVTNPNQQAAERHVSSNDKVGKRYKAANKFAIDDNDDGLNGFESEDEERNPEIDVESWCKRDEVISCFKCQELKDDGHMYPSYLILTKTHLLILREIPHNKGFAKLMKKRPLELVVQITSKRKCPNLITFKYGQSNEGEEGPSIMATDLLLIPKPYDVTRLVKQQVIKVLDGDPNSTNINSESKHNS
ncbi:TBC1 domain family member 23-like protein [Dinothrombium tinctorium]|uniref:TBC1 domain family member 23 n=1 Tax=Dinothrombium tinctorium TaxID=1965070 RepID=A0A443QTA2_9ACAR|nr:TBC1 domain family member 23-like protein [Dinothrombium tinctorium]RWS06242.1 TBC1 domain family member 23-like protein [Dinothrombium tinctorium]